jgi:hypothetical protein
LPAMRWEKGQAIFIRRELNDCSRIHALARARFPRSVSGLVNGQVT